MNREELVICGLSELYYRKTEADSVMDALEARIKSLQEENLAKDMVGAELHNENKALRHNLEDWKSENEALKARINELEANQPKWISVDDNLPNEYEQVLVFDDDSIYCAELGDFEGFKRWVTPWFSAMVELTYWMPLPEAPKNED